ncbi:MAG: mechanosensitive ion channel family protein [Erysipelotrichaceae bacterium]
MSDLLTGLVKFGDSFFQYGLLWSIILAILLLIAGSITNNILKKVLIRHFGERIGFLLRIKTTMVYSVVVLMCLSLVTPLREALGTLLGASGVIVLVLGFAAQEAVANLVGGFFITVFKPFQIGDLIRISENNLFGTVEDISFRHTVISTFENTKIIVPNATVNKSVLENLSTTNGVKGNFLEIGIAYHSDLEVAIELMKQAIATHPSFVDVRTPQQIQAQEEAVVVRLHQFGDSAIVLRTLFHTSDAAKGVAMLSDIRFQLKKEFEVHGVEIPYHQIVVHTKSLPND